MKKIFTIAAREYRAMVGTKAFLLSIVMMPILMGGSLLAMEFLKNSGSIQERTIVLIDHSGEMRPSIQVAANINNERVEKRKNGGEDGEETEFAMTKGAKYSLEIVDPATITDEIRFELSERIRSGDLYAFIEIPYEVHLLDEEGNRRHVDFYSEDSGLSESKRWITQAINDRVAAMRLQNEGIEFATVKLAQTPTKVRGLGLLSKDKDGKITEAKEKDELTAIFLPMGIMMLMFGVTLLAAQPMLESVLEEKSQRIAEVLLGSANPSQLMGGKLIGTVAGSLTVFTIYALGGYILCRYQGYADLVPFRIVPWFVLFQVLGVLFYSAIFMAVGSSVSQLKEAQSLLLPVWMMLMIPLFVWMLVVQEPNGSLATGLSLFPPATASMMVLRMATGATIPLWQPILGVVVLSLATAFVVFIAGRIFRVGILWQGKTPKFSELLRWAWSG